MFTSRRLWCALLLLACLLATMLIDPVARRMKQLAVRFASDGHVSIADAHLHRKQELLELTKLSSVHHVDNTQVTLQVDHALIKLDMPNLLDKRLISSKAKLHEMRVELASLPSPASATKLQAQSFQAALDKLLVNLQWEAFKSDCEALLTADDLLKELDDKMRGWLMRSQQIMFHADQLTSSIQTFSNPLRNMTEIRSQLKQVDQLRSEQDGLQKQFATLASILPSLSQEIQAASARDLAALRAKSKRESDALRSELAEQLVLEWTSQLLDRQRKLTQTLAVVFNNTPTGNPFNVDVRELTASPSAVRISRIEADGVFVESEQSVDFIATGELALAQQTNFQLAPLTSWSIKYHEASIGTTLNLISLPENEAWQIRANAHACQAPILSPSDRSSATATLSAAMSQIESQPKLLTVDARVDRANLNGSAKINVTELDALKKLPCAGNADLAATTLNSSATFATASPTDPRAELWIEVELAGSLLDPRLTLRSELPAEFIDGVTEQIQRRLENHCTESESKLAVAVDEKLGELKASLERHVLQAQQTVAQQQATLAEMHAKLEQNLQTRESYEYARRPTAPTSNR